MGALSCPFTMASATAGDVPFDATNTESAASYGVAAHFAHGPGGNHPAYSEPAYLLQRFFRQRGTPILNISRAGVKGV